MGIMQSFDTNSPPKRSSIVTALWIVIAVLVVALIVAIGFAIYGALKPSADNSSDQCPANAVVWQDVACCRKACKKNWNSLPLLLISLDGFRYDYLQRNKTPSLKRLIGCGVHAPFMYPSYPTKTFPNHYSIVTGLYPESHGIIDNKMYDATIDPPGDRFFALSSPSARNPQWWKGEPFWNTIVKNGMKSATYFWPGSDVRIQNMTPTYNVRYNKSVPFYIRVDQVVDWLLLPDDKRPIFLTMYLSEPDSDGHKYGPESPYVTNTLLSVDAQINYLLTRLFQEDMLHCLNLVILADHGMQQILETIPLEEYLPVDGLSIFGGPIARISMNESGLTPEAIKKDLMCKNKKFRVYDKDTMPRRTHYFKNYRIGDVLVDGDPGVEVEQNSSLGWYETSGGDHGYDNRFDSMHALFLAWGPKYNQNYTVQPFQNVELYNFLADTLNIENRAPNNGTTGALDDVFVSPPGRNQAQNGKEDVPFCQKHQLVCGICQEKAPCTSPWANGVRIAGSTNSSRQLCSGQICDTMVVYDSDLELAAAVFEMSDSVAIPNSASTGTKAPDTCTRVTFAQTDCERISAVEAALGHSNMTMFSLATTSSGQANNAVPVAADGDASADDNPLATAWELKTPMHNGFYSGVWRSLENLTQEYTRRFGRLIVVSGPIFDKDNDGLGDATIQHRSTGVAPTPTHYYRIVIRCMKSWTLPFDTPWKSCQGSLDTISFVVPHTPKAENCMEELSYLRQHMARIRDIELLTGLEILRDIADDMFHKSALLRTQINEELW